MCWRPPIAEAHTPGYVYVLHFHAPLGHARHYIGWTVDPARRIAQHRGGRRSSVPIMRELHAAGIGFDVAAVVNGTHADERRLKNRGGGPRACPICQGRVPVALERLGMVDLASLAVAA